MSKRTKIIALITTMCICLTIFLTCVFAFSNTTLNVVSTINFNPDGSFVRVLGQVYRGTTSDLTDDNKLLDANYSFKGYSYEPISETDDTPDGSQSKDITAWDIGSIEFITNENDEIERYIKYELKFKNYGEDTVIVRITGMPIDVDGLSMTYNRDTTISVEPNMEETFTALIELTDVRNEISNQEFDFYISIRKEGTPNPIFTYTYQIFSGEGLLTTPTVDGEPPPPEEDYPTSQNILDYISLYANDMKLNLNEEGLEMSTDETYEGSFEVEDGSILKFIEKNSVQINADHVSKNVVKFGYINVHPMMIYRPYPQMFIYDTTGKIVLSAYIYGDYNMQINGPHIVNGR